MKLSAARVFVRDLGQAQAFYSAVLGLSLRAGGVEFGFCVLDAGGIQLVLEPVDDQAPGDDQALVGRFTGLSFAVDSAHAQHARLSALGVVFTSPPQAQPWGGILATFKDPSGNQLQLVQGPGAS